MLKDYKTINKVERLVIGFDSLDMPVYAYHAISQNSSIEISREEIDYIKTMYHLIVDSEHKGGW